MDWVDFPLADCVNENEDENEYADQEGQFRDERTGSLTLSANQIGANTVNSSQDPNSRINLEAKSDKKKKDKKCC